ncbi:MAG: outer membrane beta-barrel protein [Alphaproteobacteria bacterium]|nr:outer membrane beta-barrel protein [Alphaproteobacteria bacterium]
MRKLTTALLIAASVTGAAFAEGNTASSGFYLGANAGFAANLVKYDYQNQGLTATSNSSVAANTNTASMQQITKMNNKTAALFGVFAGYGMVVGQGAYFGGELFGGLDTTNVSPFDDSASGKNVGYWKSTLKRTNFYGLAARVGYMVTPSTLAYIRLAVEAGKWKASVIPNAATIDTLGSGSNIALDKQTVSKSKNSLSFAPGFGMEAYITKNMFIRAEYSYLFGPKITMTQDISAITQSLLNGSSVQHNFKVTQHQFKIGVGYKF